MKAFPSQYNTMTGQTEYGMELRDWLAGMALVMDKSTDPSIIAERAYKIADAMLKQREIKDEQPTSSV